MVQTAHSLSRDGKNSKIHHVHTTLSFSYLAFSGLDSGTVVVFAVDFLCIDLPAATRSEIGFFLNPVASPTFLEGLTSMDLLTSTRHHSWYLLQGKALGLLPQIR